MKRSYPEDQKSSDGNKNKFARLERPESKLQTRPSSLFKGSGVFPYFRKPTEIGCLSLDIKRNFYNDRSQLKHYISPKDIYNVKFDLTKGYHNFIEKDENSEEYINDILKWISCNREKFLLEDEKRKSDEEIREIRYKQELISSIEYTFKVLCILFIHPCTIFLLPLEGP